MSYNSLNHKDGRAITGKGKIVRQWPLVSVIDFVGNVLESAGERYRPGDKVVPTGWGVGEETSVAWRNRHGSRPSGRCR
ncbi:hypothetical protein [Aeromonas rivipollensis]|uniref:hypothetical protein n=1 Tax=Aeromonas rivipollensis TaxID=948519 RepID=UPI0038E5C672